MAKHSNARGSPARIRPESARTSRRQNATGTPQGKVCLKSNTSRHFALRTSRSHGRQDRHLHAGAEPGRAATGSTRARTPARRQRPAAGAPESRARPDPDGAAAAPRREPARRPAARTPERR
ncbi:hypothetical protein [Arthrobacter crystallopoietes]|uniref:hypothetical protein n=1 Tax=Crystallibacter crystallopoietes TaxID=37928 RepID=UPI000C783E46|nr:hypothetical protein [Arthrobacter crystallopoietes]AUI53650.1 hypothetical protein AC20117_22035 [Arthrobacter crystallopoietes]